MKTRDLASESAKKVDNIVILRVVNNDKEINQRLQKK